MLNTDRGNIDFMIEEKYKEYEEIKELRSPLKYRDSILIPDQKNITINWGNLNQLSGKCKPIQATEIKILGLIATYGIMTNALITQSLNFNGNYISKKIKEKIAKLVKMGAVHRFTLYSKDINRKLNILILPPAGQSFVKCRCNKKPVKIRESDLSNVGSIFAKLSLNQMLINYRRRLPLFNMAIQRNFDLKRFLSIELTNKNIVTFYSVRRDQKIDNLLEWIRELSKKSEELVLIVEDYQHTSELSDLIFNKVETEYLLFVLDTDLLDDYCECSCLKVDKISSTQHRIPYSNLRGFKCTNKSKTNA